ncbi:hypothetical protein ACFL35_17625, partial [Candidatus Riflebacteria bacterium]
AESASGVNLLGFHPGTSVLNWIRGNINRGYPVIHISVHTFTPILHEKIRRCDIGILYDPGRKTEKIFARAWINSLKATLDNFITRANYPYRGKADNFNTFLRKIFSFEQYLGVEIEVNQKFPLREKRKWPVMRKKIVASLVKVIPCHIWKNPHFH